MLAGPGSVWTRYSPMAATITRFTDRRPASARTATTSWKPPQPSWPLPSQPIIPNLTSPPPHRAPPVKWAHGTERAKPQRGFRFQNPVSGLVGTAHLTAQFLEINSNQLAFGAEEALGKALAESTRTCEEAQNSMAECELKLVDIFKVNDQRMQAKALLIGASKAIVRLTRAAAVLEDAASGSHWAHVDVERGMAREMESQRRTFGAELAALDAALAQAHASLAAAVLRAQQLSGENAALTAGVAVCDACIGLLRSEVSELEETAFHATTGLRAIVTSLTEQLRDEIARSSGLQQGVTRRDVALSLLRVELQSLEGDMAGFETDTRFSLSALLADLKAERDRASKEKVKATTREYELRNDIDRLSRQLVDANNAKEATLMRLNLQDAEIERLRCEHATAEAQWHAAEDALKTSIESQRLDAEKAETRWRDKENKLNRAAERQRLIADSKQAELKKAQEQQRIAAGEREGELLGKIKQKQLEAHELHADFGRQLDEYKLVAAAREAEIYQILERERLAADSNEAALKEVLEQQRQQSLAREVELKEQIETVGSLSRQQVEQLSRQMRAQEAQYSMERRDLTQELDQEHAAREELETKLIATATKLREAKKEGEVLEERKMEVVRRELNLARALKVAKTQQEDLAAKLHSETAKREQSEAKMGREVNRLKNAWRRAAGASTSPSQLPTAATGATDE